MHKDIIDPLDAEASGRCVNENEQKAGGDKAVASRSCAHIRPSVAVRRSESFGKDSYHHTGAA